MRFLLINQFYPPDVAPTGLYLHELAQVLVQRGHQVKVICSRRSYDGGKTFPRHEIMDGVEVSRLRATGYGRRGFAGKIADYASFYFSLMGMLLWERKRPDVILSLTTPPYVGLLGKLAAKWHGARHAHWIMDLYPDVMFAYGVSSGGFFFKWLQKLTHFQLRGADPVFALGPVMAENVARYHRPDERNKKDKAILEKTGSPSSLNDPANPVRWVPLWSNPELSPWPDNEPNPLRAERGWTAEEVVFLYSGNMGLGHRFGEFLEAARQLGATGPRWVFAGGGKRRTEIEAFAKLNSGSRISFLEYVPHAQLRAHLGAADVHLASLDSSWQGFMVPSKLQGSFAAGRPILYVGGNQCETARWIQESGGGWVVEENDAAGLLAAIRQAQDPMERRKRGQAALNFARQHFQGSINCTCLARWLEFTG
jgi:glycosyltransferase involved in cell wall biosynthesis